MSSRKPAAAVANSHRKNSPPSPAVFRTIAGVRPGVRPPPGDNAVGAGGLVAGFAGYRDDTLALLTGALGDKLLDPQAKALDRRREDERQLVAPAPRARAHEGAECQPGVAARIGLAACVGHRAAGRHQFLDVNPHQRRRHQAEE